MANLKAQLAAVGGVPRPPIRRPFVVGSLCRERSIVGVTGVGSRHRPRRGWKPVAA